MKHGKMFKVLNLSDECIWMWLFIIPSFYFSVHLEFFVIKFFLTDQEYLTSYC